MPRSDDQRAGSRVKQWDGPWRLLGPWWVRYWNWSDALGRDRRRFDAIYIGGQR